MPFTGQPVPSTVYNAYRAKVSDGKSVRVPVTEKTTIEAGLFYEISGFFGSAMQSVKTLTGETSEVILNIEQAEYETDQIEKTKSFKLGTKIYFDKGKFTETKSDTARFAGTVTQGKDANGVIWFILAPQGGNA
ncbi:capsid cement protein [Lysinibacillus sp. NPDC094403]|uniref:capsid cement protein n=1 Tax=Lysinibacillus sp. NPDC094403 TaxID=3390581 RepID=UPI003D06A144